MVEHLAFWLNVFTLGMALLNVWGILVFYPPYWKWSAAIGWILVGFMLLFDIIKMSGTRKGNG